MKEKKKTKIPTIKKTWFERVGGRKNFYLLLFVVIFCFNFWIIAQRPMTEIELAILGGVLLGGSTLNVIQKFRSNGNDKDKSK